MASATLRTRDITHEDRRQTRTGTAVPEGGDAPTAERVEGAGHANALGELQELSSVNIVGKRVKFSPRQLTETSVPSECQPRTPQ